MTTKQKIDEILKREGVREFYPNKYALQLVEGEPFKTSYQKHPDEYSHVIDAAYVAKLEKLVLELGEMGEALEVSRDSLPWYAVSSDTVNIQCEKIQKITTGALTRLNKLLDEMK